MNLYVIFVLYNVSFKCSIPVKNLDLIMRAMHFNFEILADLVRRWSQDLQRERPSRSMDARDRPAVLYGQGRPVNARDFNPISRSDRFHMEKRLHVCEVANRLAQVQNTVTYADIGRNCNPPMRPDAVRKSLKTSGYKFYRSRFLIFKFDVN